MPLLEFYGAECPHCVTIAPIVDRLKEGYAIEQLETWHNRENAKKQKQYDKGMCGGVPFFINTDSGEMALRRRIVRRPTRLGARKITKNQ